MARFEIESGSRPLKRIVFHEITASALEEALAHPSELRIDLVKAQQARRILDRIVGYELSPLLWKKTGKNWLSAGRVQTVALRLIVEREKERRAFKLEKYFQIYGLFKSTEELKGKLISKKTINLLRYPILFHFYAGDYTYTKTSITDEIVPSIMKDLEGGYLFSFKTEEEVIKRYPHPLHNFLTSAGCIL